MSGKVLYLRVTDTGANAHGDPKVCGLLGPIRLVPERLEQVRPRHARLTPSAFCVPCYRIERTARHTPRPRCSTALTSHWPSARRARPDSKPSRS